MTASRRQRGITATETIFSLFIVTILVVLVMNLFPATMLGIRRTEQRLQAEEIAQSTLDQYMIESFSDLTLGDTNLPAVKLKNFEYAVVVNVSEDTAQPSDRLRLIKATVSWTHRGKEESLSREIWRADVAR